MSYFNICPDCGSHLDPGEKCDCKNEKAREQEVRMNFFNKYLMAEKQTGQLAFTFDGIGGRVSDETKMCC